MKRNKIRRGPKTQSRFRLNKARQALKTHLPELRERYGVHALWIFGSYLRGEQYKNSDLDMNGPLPFSNLFDLSVI